MKTQRKGFVLGALLFTLLCSAGCLDVRAKLEADGSGTLVMRISPLNPVGDERIRNQLPSPSVKLAKYTYTDSVGTYFVRFDDVRKLRTSALFRDLRIKYPGEAGSQRTISVSLPKRPRAEKEPNLPDDDYVAIALTLTVPGPITETNGKKGAEDVAEWKILVGQMLGKGYIEAQATFQAG